MRELAEPDDPEDLWLARGDEVSGARPLTQGDVILLDDRPVCVVAHPCSMRRGQRLHAEQAVVAVDDHAVSSWQGHLDWMPLPGFAINGINDPAAHLRRIQSAPTAGLLTSKRLASLSDHGIHLLQQRLALAIERAKSHPHR